MVVLGERDDDFFDFRDQVFGESARDSIPFSPQEEAVLNRDSEIHTSYILVNALLNLLIRKGIIYPHEVKALVAELHAEYIKKRGKTHE